MKLRAIEIDELDQAATLLHEGFSKRSKVKWLADLRDMHRHAEELGYKNIGFIASNKETDLGICLAVPLIRSIYEAEPVKAINIAAFYMKPEFKWMAALFLRRIMTENDVDYVDVTASSSMRKVNAHLGFTTSATGLLVVPLIATAFRPFKRAKIRRYNPKKSRLFADNTSKILQDHIALGCRVLTIEQDGQIHPVILSPKKRGSLPSARVILTKDRQLIENSIGSLARYLLIRGLFFLEMDVFSKPDLWESSLRKRSAPVQSTRISSTEAIDHTYTELVFVR
ncbi:hypothetical protein [Paenochrobactrum pullorum]|uniref:hypothetical protein n=1 Tax=Paenochrobactrum pullorum TaxID=1324351 RepID=UPI0035BC0ED3